jgi:hypothetical protein
VTNKHIQEETSVVELQLQSNNMTHFPILRIKIPPDSEKGVVEIQFLQQEFISSVKADLLQLATAM